MVFKPEPEVVAKRVEPMILESGPEAAREFAGAEVRKLRQRQFIQLHDAPESADVEGGIVRRDNISGEPAGDSRPDVTPLRSVAHHIRPDAVNHDVETAETAAGVMRTDQDLLAFDLTAAAERSDADRTDAAGIAVGRFKIERENHRCKQELRLLSPRISGNRMNHESNQLSG